MKELFELLSNVFNFFNEKRLVYQETPEPSPKKPPEGAEAGEKAPDTKREAKAAAERADKLAQNAKGKVVERGLKIDRKKVKPDKKDKMPKPKDNVERARRAYFEEMERLQTHLRDNLKNALDLRGESAAFKRMNDFLKQEFVYITLLRPSGTEEGFNKLMGTMENLIIDFEKKIIQTPKDLERAFHKAVTDWLDYNKRHA